MDGTVNFYRGWEQYKNGFGHAGGEYWLGKGMNEVEDHNAFSSLESALQILNCWPVAFMKLCTNYFVHLMSLFIRCSILGLETIHLLTLKKNYELRVDLEDFEGNKVNAKYKSFGISPMAINAELDGYTLQVSGFENGGAGKPAAEELIVECKAYDTDI